MKRRQLFSKILGRKGDNFVAPPYFCGELFVRPDTQQMDFAASKLPKIADFKFKNDDDFLDDGGLMDAIRGEAVCEILEQADFKFKTATGEFSAHSCLGCAGDCVDACENGVLRLESGIIKFVPQSAGCTFCEACAKACEAADKEVLSLKFSPKIRAKTSINTATCLAWVGTICDVCAQVCKYGAIDFFGLYRPLVNQNCTNCGVCVGVCVAAAVKIEHLEG